MIEKEFETGTTYLIENSRVFRLLVDNLGKIKYKKRDVSFSAFVKLIISQQLSSKAAGTIFQRVYNHSVVEKKELDPKILSDIDDEKFKSYGVSKFKAKFIRNLAHKFIENPNFMIKLNELTDNEARYEIKKLDGFGDWSADIILLNYFGRLDVFPKGDVTLVKAHKKLFNSGLSKSLDEISWAQPYRGILAYYFWKWIDSGIMEMELNRNDSL